MKIFNWCKKHLIWALIILLCLIPLSINILFLCPLFDWGGGDDSGWLGFWGGYLGVAVSAIGAYVTYKQHLQDNERKSKPYFILKYMNDLNDVDKKLIKVVYKNRRTTSNNSEEESKKDEVKELINNITNENVPILALQAKIINPITDIYIKVNTIRPTGNEKEQKETYDYYKLDWIDNNDIFFFVPQEYFEGVQFYNEIFQYMSEIYISYIDYMGSRKYLCRKILSKNGVHTVLTENIDNKDAEFKIKPEVASETVISTFI